MFPRRARSKVVLFAAAVVAVGLLVLAIRHGVAAPGESVVGVRPKTASGVHAAELATESLELAPVATSTDRHEPVADTLSVGQPEDRHVEGNATFLLRGRVYSFRQDLQLTRLAVRALGPDSDATPNSISLPAEVDSIGGFELDVTTLVRTHGSIAPAIEITATHPKLDRAVAAFAVPLPSNPDAHVVIQADVQFPWRTVSLVCRAWALDGGADAISIAAYTYESGRVVNPWYGPVAAEAEKPATIQVRAPAEYAVVAVCKGYRPATVRVVAGVAESIELQPFVLDHGVSIRGRVVLADGGTAPGALLQCTPAKSLDPRQLDGHGLAWCGDEFEWASTKVHIDGRGKYEVAELGPRLYTLSLSGLPGGYVDRVDALEVFAPSSTADVALASSCEVHLAFFGAGRAKATRFGVRQVRSNRSQSFGMQSSKDDGTAQLFVDPNTPTWIVVVAEGGLERLFTIPTCTAGRVTDMRIDL